MRDPGLDQAIGAAGGVGALARKLGISQPSVSNWSRVPAERVVSVEGATGIDRRVLRPDLYGEVGAGDADEIDAARVREYALLSVLLRRAADADFLARLATIGGDPSPLGMAHAALAEAAAVTNVERVEREFFNLFVGIGRGELLPYGSYYLTGFLNERPLARLRDDLARLGVERVEDEVEPEDHAAVLCEIMAGLVGGRFETSAGADRRLFEKHLVPWVGRFFADLEQAEAADFYRRVGTVGRVFIDIEREAFALGP
jgi:TorA maturation chaperone TorD